MASKSLIFQTAEAAKFDAIKSQQQTISKMYKDWAKDINKKAVEYSHKQTASAIFKRRQLKALEKQLVEASKIIANQTYHTIKSNMYVVADELVKANAKWLQGLGFPIKGINAAFSSVPMNVVDRIITGQVYESGWSLSKAIWSDNEVVMKDIHTTIARGVAENQSIQEIAQSLEQYVNPDKALSWNKRMKDGKKIYKGQVDYSAQRLARTMVQHSYQQSFAEVTKDNPFIEEMVWRANGGRACELCLERDGQHFPKDNFPMDHPNGMCTMEPVVVNDLTDQLADWINGEDGTYPEIDNFASKFGYKPSIARETAAIQKITGKTANTPIKQATKRPTKQTSKVQSEQTPTTYKQLSEQEYITRANNPYNVADIEDIQKIQQQKQVVFDVQGTDLQSQASQLIHGESGYVSNYNAEMLNGVLRSKGKYPLRPEHKKLMNALDEAIGSYQIDQDVVLSRFVKEDYIRKTFDIQKLGPKGTLSDDALAAMRKQIGSVYENEAYMSTTYQSGHVFDDRLVRMQIQCDKGTNMFVTTNFREGEIVLGRDTRYQLVDIIDHRKTSVTLENAFDKYEFNGIDIVVRMLP